MSSFDDELWVRCPEKHFGVSNLFLNVLLRREVFGGVVVANLDFVLKKKCIVRVRESMVLSKGLSFGFGFIHEEIASFGGRYEILPLGAQGLHRFGCGGLDSFGGAFGFIVKGKVVVRFYHDLFFQRENFWRWVGVGLTLTNGGLNIGVQLTNLLLQGGLPFRVFLQLRRLSFRESFRGLSVDSLTLAPQVIEFVLLCHQPRKRFFVSWVMHPCLSDPRSLLSSFLPPFLPRACPCPNKPLLSPRLLSSPGLSPRLASY